MAEIQFAGAVGHRQTAKLNSLANFPAIRYYIYIYYYIYVGWNESENAYFLSHDWLYLALLLILEMMEQIKRKEGGRGWGSKREREGGSEGGRAGVREGGSEGGRE